MTRSHARSAAVLLTSLLFVASAIANNGSRSPAGPAGPAPAPNSAFQANATITESFDTVSSTSNGCVTGWTCTNLSSPLGTTGWFQGNNTVFNAQAGATTAYIGANFNNTTGNNTISNWLISPQVNFGTGATLSFWTRTTDTAQYPDRLEVRISTNGASTNVGASHFSVGDFTTLLFTVNPSLLVGAGTCPSAANGYPTAWCQITLTNVAGIPTSGSGRIAFRYYVTAGGPTGSNSDYIGIDTFSFNEGTPASPPQFAYAPTPASTVTATGGGLVGSTGTFTITPSVAVAGIGSGAPATTTTTCTPPTGAFSGFAQSVTATGTGAISGGPLTGSCTLGAVAATQTLTCSENRGGTPTTVSWTLSCPAGIAPPTIAYSPAAGSTVSFTGVTNVGTSGSGTITATPSGGSGTGAAVTTTVNGCTVAGADAASFSGAAAVNLSFVGNTTTAQSISLGCTSGVAVRSATLSCNETAGGNAPVTRSWPLSCPAGALLPMTSSPAAGGTITFAPVATGGSRSTPVTFSSTNPVPVTVVCTAPGGAFMASPLSMNVPANGSATMTVTFAPGVSGNQTATLSCSVNGSAQTMNYALSASAFVAAIDTLDGRSLLLLASLLTLLGLGVLAHRRGVATQRG